MDAWTHVFWVNSSNDGSQDTWNTKLPTKTMHFSIAAITTTMWNMFIAAANSTTCACNNGNLYIFPIRNMLPNKRVNNTFACIQYISEKREREWVNVFFFLLLFHSCLFIGFLFKLCSALVITKILYVQRIKVDFTAQCDDKLSSA